MPDKTERFIALIKNFSSPNVFNPWRDSDAENDIGSESPLIRSTQLTAYLSERIGKSKYCLMGEAIGYQGGHFSGIAMTSERILLGHLSAKRIKPEYPFSSISPKRTSKESVRPMGFTEPTATIVWSSLLEAGIRPYDFVIWNTFAWHPYDKEKGMLSNRKPTDEELKAGNPALKAFMELFPQIKIIAVGKVAEKELENLGIKSIAVRHPANGGAGKFRQQIAEIIRA